MSRSMFQPGDRVIHKRSRRKGTVVEDQWNCCTPDEVPVQFDRGEGYEGTDWRLLSCMEALN